LSVGARANKRESILMVRSPGPGKCVLNTTFIFKGYTEAHENGKVKIFNNISNQIKSIIKRQVSTCENGQSDSNK
jgi:hypothetical protein